MINFSMNPLNARIFIRCLIGLSRLCQYASISLDEEPNSRANGLAISGIESGSLSKLVFGFPVPFFDAFDVNQSSNTVGETVVVSCKLMCRIFKNVSPNKITSVSVKFSPDVVEVTFSWRNGIMSNRRLSTSEIPERMTVPTSSPSPKQGSSLMTFSPRYIQNLLSLIPENRQLWALSIATYPIDISAPLSSTNSNGNTLYLTNWMTGLSSQGAVQLSTSQAELNRNGSFFSKSECMSASLNNYHFL